MPLTLLRESCRSQNVNSLTYLSKVSDIILVQKFNSHLQILKKMQSFFPLLMSSATLSYIRLHDIKIFKVCLCLPAHCLSSFLQRRRLQTSRFREVSPSHILTDHVCASLKRQKRKTDFLRRTHFTWLIIL